MAIYKNQSRPCGPFLGRVKSSTWSLSVFLDATPGNNGKIILLTILPGDLRHQLMILWQSIIAQTKNGVKNAIPIL